MVQKLVKKGVFKEMTNPEYCPKDYGQLTYFANIQDYFKWDVPEEESIQSEPIFIHQSNENSQQE